MAKRTIVKLGDEVLRKMCKEVTVFDEKLATLLDDMAQTMYDANGVGLAAPQIGILKRVAVVDTDGVLYEIINPVITEQSGEIEELEGCLSVPERHGMVKRPEKIKVLAQDRNGKNIEINAEGYLARALCHEIDHLSGVLYIDKVTEEVKE